MSTKAIRTLAKVSIVCGAVFLVTFSCAAVTGHFSPLYAAELVINLAVIIAGVWILNQTE